ncbi:MAG: 30S ribosomal protein S12 methylthiotransferase RimO [Rikenellaceae bacterium]|nr:30S ribosomal protein S12 methylthiotransferase RimO [Rikenellaceae bacterium]
MKKHRINIITLGCSKNIVDSEYLMSQLDKNGFEVFYDSPEGADTVIINTCGFIGDAKEESINTILQFAELRTRGKIQNLFVMGCLSERYRDELITELPEVDEFFGVRNTADIVEKLGGQYIENDPGRFLSTPSHYAYLKISEGCNRKCGFCAIPLIRGEHDSKPIETLTEESRLLAANGVKELIVIAQDTTYYGVDLYGRRRLADLLKELCRIDGIEWIRLHYAYPSGFPDDVINVMAEEPKICKYLDIPFQHISDSQLKAMKRGNTKEETYELIRKLKTKIPDIAIRTTLLTGYPGEDEEDFSELLEFVEKMKFERLGVFPYSEEEGTYSANNLTDNIPYEIKQYRVDKIMSLQNNISLEKNVNMIGSIQRIIIDREEGGYFVGRTQYDSPEVDQEVLVKSAKNLIPGMFLDVKITSADDYDLYAEVVQGPL